jgi:hypothetical protein
LVEVVQAEGACEGVYELYVAGGGGDDVGEVQGEEEGFADHGFVVDVADFDLRFFSLSS